MIKTMAKQNGGCRFVHPLKLTALLYLKDALIAERYEKCPEIIVHAKELGVTDSQIQRLLEDPRRSPE